MLAIAHLHFLFPFLLHNKTGDTTLQGVWVLLYIHFHWYLYTIIQHRFCWAAQIWVELAANRRPAECLKVPKDAHLWILEIVIG